MNFLEIQYKDTNYSFISVVCDKSAQEIKIIVYKYKLDLIAT